MVSIKTNFEMPRGDDPIKQAQRLSQDLSMNFKSINNLLKSNSSISNIFLPVGSIIHSMLTLSQFQAILGTDWAMFDGSSCAGSLLESVTGISILPDARGCALRGKDNGRGLNPDGDLALGTYQADQVISHSHPIYTYVAGPGTIIESLQAVSMISTSAVSSTSYETAFGGNETRMKNITVNIFIKIN
jgi:hypothetical protein